jgi:acyl transferase domain-containing protein/acyl carrier protein
MQDRYNQFAIVGMGGIFPDAPELGTFWRNICDNRVSITGLPEDSLERKVFYRPEVLRKIDKGDKSYTDLSARITSLDFDPESFRIPPAVAKHMDDNQKVALLSAQQALSGGVLDSVSKERVSVFMGNTMTGTLYHDFYRRFCFDSAAYHLEHGPLFRKCVPEEHRQSLIAELRERTLAGTFGVTEDSAPGVLPNIIAARIASVFDLHGHTMVIDSACASALAAVICGIQQLRSGESDAVICGAADMPNREAGRVLFSGIGALSPDGSFPFDARANGFVIGQGGGIIVMKRLQDAIEAGNRIVALIAGYGQTSDGKGKAIAAPNEIWQANTIQRAYQVAGYSVDTVELIEAHGTSTQVGDKSETNALKSAFAALGATRRGFCGIGSVKSNIGHLKSAAGIAGLLKAAMAIQNKWLPPTASFQRLSPAINLADSPFYILSEGKSWAAKDHPRRAGVSSFGFGGANYHIALSEYREEDHRGRAQVVAKPSRLPAPLPRMPAGGALDDLQEVALFRGVDATQILAEVVALRSRLESQAGDLREVLATMNCRTDLPRAQRLAFTVCSRADLQAKLDLVHACGANPQALGALRPQGIFFSAEPAVDPSHVAVLFPGQGSQYPDMLANLRQHYAAAKNTEARANRLWQALAGNTVSALIDTGDGDKDSAESRLRETVNTHPAILAVSLAAHAVLEQVGLRCTRMLGHSLGEFTALVAAGRLSLADGMMLMRARGAAFARIPEGKTGIMLALPLGPADAKSLISDGGRPVALANLNSPRQSIASGAEDDIAALAELATSRGIKTRRLNVSRAFHSPLMQEAQDAFAVELRKADFLSGHAQVLAASTGEYYGIGEGDVLSVLSTQITRTVDFVGGIERLYADGVRMFVEVGPSQVLSGLARDILGQRPGLVLSADSKGDGIDAFLKLLCQLHVAGLPIDPTGAPTGAALVGGEAAMSARETSPMVATVSSQPAALPSALDRIVYSGVSAGLPGSFKDAFRDDNFDQLFEGRNFIERLTDDERRRLLDLRISKVVKSEQGASIVELQALSEVIQLAGKLGRLDLAANYQVDDKDIQTMSSCVAHAVAAGYEALRDAQIPLVMEYVRTASGHLLPDRWALPREMQANTGIIFANGFPMIDPIIAEVSRHLGATLGNRAREAVLDFYDTLIPRVTHAESRKLLSDWFALNYARLCPTPSHNDVYRFNHQLMTQISLQANNRLAKGIVARGPNFQLNAACSSAATAIMLAEELIRAGRVERMVVIGADDPTSAQCLPYLGAGFLSTGACTSEGDLHEAAVPFDKRRNGMIMGSGAIGVVVEKQSACARRGTIPVCELLGTHVFNAASHGSQLDVPRYAEELEVFMKQMEARHGLSRATLAPDLVYFSHEPYTPARGGCSESEATALRHVFGAQASEIEVSNTKGMTGHTMGASIEDVVAAKALQHGRVPPVVNYKVPDPALDGLKLSRGGKRAFGHTLRMAAGFGSQGNYVLLRRVAVGEDRVENLATQKAWLANVSGLANPEVMRLGRMLVIKDTTPGSVIAERPRIHSLAGALSSNNATAPVGMNKPVAREPRAAANAVADNASVQERVLDVVASITGYKRSLLDLDMELEADLGIDTVKQATVLATLAESSGMTDLGEVRLSDYPTLRGLVGLFSGGPAHVAESGFLASDPPPPEEARNTSEAVSPDIAEIVRQVVAGITGYKLALIAPNMELEADLGVDTVKQATILAMLSERFGIAGDAMDFRISDFPTVGHLIGFFQTCKGRPAGIRDAAPATVAAAKPEAVAPVRMRAPSAHAPETPRLDVRGRLLALVAAHTPYPVEMLELDLTLESDLGLDDETRERLRAACVEQFDLDIDWQLPMDGRLDEVASAIAARTQEEREDDDSELARQILTLVPAPPMGDAQSLTDQRVWIWGDDAGCVQAMQAALEGRTAEIRTVVVPSSGSTDEMLALVNQETGPAADVLIDLTACGSADPFLSTGPEATGMAIARAADCRFVAWKHLADRQQIPARVLAVTAIDGQHGLAGQVGPINPVFGIFTGFYKSLRKEWPASRVAILDVEPAGVTSPSATAFAPVLAELAGLGMGVEIGYRAGLRHRLVLTDAPMPDSTSARSLQEDEVIVATGGGAGITATIVKVSHACTQGAWRLLAAPSWTPNPSASTRCRRRHVWPRKNPSLSAWLALGNG